MRDSLSALLRRRRGRLAVMLALASVSLLVAGVLLRGAWPLAQPHPTTAAAAASLAVLLGAIAAVLWRADREVARVRRALAAGISHDLRTPLAQIRMFTEMLLMRRDRSGEERAQWLEAIERDSHRLTDVMENLLLFIHAEGTDPFPARHPADLGSLIEDVAAGFARRAAARRMRIVASPAAGVVALIDADAVRQAVFNLLDNAVRYGPVGQTVTIALDTNDSRAATITVADDGPGIPPSDRRRVWHAFVRLDVGGGASQGSGLGLAVVRRVVEAHGGRTRIGGGAGGGARVSMSLPLAPAASRPRELLPGATPGVEALRTSG